MTSRLIVGRGVARRVSWAKGLGRSLMVVSEPAAWRHGGRAVFRALRAARGETYAHLLACGEAAKSWAEVECLLSAMLRRGLGRDGAVVAVGGGTVTDAAGFAAAVYMRGIPWASVPTTLLGQLDSGLGGKTAINLPQGKNLVGAFHQPAVVVCDTNFLKSLPARERLSGLAEAIKMGLVFDPRLWRYIRSHWNALIKGSATPTARVIRAAGAWKLKVCAEDERETKGRRELLNFGHTIGHALEAVCGLGTLRHGEAVILGMRAALELSMRHAGLSRPEAAHALEFLEALPVRLPRSARPRALLAAARLDKKVREGRLRFVLLKRLGVPVVMPLPKQAVLKVL